MVHLYDLTTLYLTLLKAIIKGENPPSGKAQGYYFAENGVYSWKALYQGIANRLATKGLVKDPTLRKPDQNDLEAIGKVLKCPAEFVAVSVGGELVVPWYTANGGGRS